MLEKQEFLHALRDLKVLFIFLILEVAATSAAETGHYFRSLSLANGKKLSGILEVTQQMLKKGNFRGQCNSYNEE